MNYHNVMLSNQAWTWHFYQLFYENKNLPITWHTKQLGIGISSSAKLSQIPYSIDNSLSNNEIFPEGKLDADLQQVDLRSVNSWRLKLGEIHTNEMLEVQLVNSVAPFVLSNRLVNIIKKENKYSASIIKSLFPSSVTLKQVRYFL